MVSVDMPSDIVDQCRLEDGDQSTHCSRNPVAISSGTQDSMEPWWRKAGLDQLPLRLT